MSEWISVKDRLPDVYQVVQICWPSSYDDEPMFAWGGWTDADDGWAWGVVESFRSEIKHDALNEWIEADEHYPVTHWRPLTKPPAEYDDPDWLRATLREAREDTSDLEATMQELSDLGQAAEKKMSPRDTGNDHERD